MWASLFTGQPTTVFDTYAKTANALDTLRSNKIANALNQVKLNYAQPMAQQALSQAQSKSTILGSDAQYENQLNQLKALQMNLQAQGDKIDNAIKSESFKYLPQQQQMALQLKQEQIDQIKQNIALAPQKLAEQQGRFGEVYQASKFLSTLPAAQRATILAQNPQLVNAIAHGGLNLAANRFNPLPMQGASSLPQNSPANQQPTVGTPNTNTSVVPTASSTPAIPAVQDAAMPQLSPQVQQQQLAAQIDANKKSASPQAYRRLESALELDSFMNNPKFDQLATNAAKYAGLLGKGQAAIDSLKQSNPEAYEDYLEFHNNYKSTITNIMRQMEGLGVQESTRNEIQGNLTQAFDSYTGNPARAIDQYNRLKSMLSDLTNSLSKAAQPVFPGALERSMGVHATPPISQRVNIISPDGKTGTISSDEVGDALKNGWKLK